MVLSFSETKRSYCYIVSLHPCFEKEEKRTVSVIVALTPLETTPLLKAYAQNLNNSLTYSRKPLLTAVFGVFPFGGSRHASFETFCP